MGLCFELTAYAHGQARVTLTDALDLLTVSSSSEELAPAPLLHQNQVGIALVDYLGFAFRFT